MKNARFKKGYLSIKTFALHWQRLGGQADVSSHSSNDQLFLPRLSNSFRESGIIPRIDDALSFDKLFISF
jgi:hypothetical protein